MKKHILFLYIAITTLQATPSAAQRSRTGPPKGDNVQTDAVAKKKSEREAKMDEYKMRREHQKKIQDKATQKRMKRNEKHSQKQFIGKNTAWYKRIFRKKKF